MTGLLRFSACLLSSVLLLGASRVVAQQMVSVSGKEVNLRSGPGTQHPVDWILSSTAIDCGSPAAAGAGSKCAISRTTGGWIFRPLTSTTPYHIVKVKVANLRSQPTTRSRILAKLAYGDALVRSRARATGSRCSATAACAAGSRAACSGVGRGRACRRATVAPPAFPAAPAAPCPVASREPEGVPCVRATWRDRP